MEDYIPMNIGSKNKSYIFEVKGKVVPYTRMTRRGKYVNKQAKRYLNWQQSFGWEIKAQMKQNNWTMIPPIRPIHLYLRYRIQGERKTHFDMSNVLKGVEDAIQGIVYENDREVDSFVAWREWGTFETGIYLEVSQGNPYAQRYY